MYKDPIMDLMAWNTEVTSLVPDDRDVSYPLPLRTRVKSLVEVAVVPEGSDA